MLLEEIARLSPDTGRGAKDYDGEDPSPDLALPLSSSEQARHSAKQQSEPNKLPVRNGFPWVPVASAASKDTIARLGEGPPYTISMQSP